ncbi:multiple epidermal growth factor-like domains protein 10 [Drosophila montana]|uniref:multiple epidermal growth factor-like domains protein 10 n=1 Tax=Drosophila montana TaxID=40370 RepID=UPI00313CEF04
MLALRIIIIFVLLPGVLLASICSRTEYGVGKQKPHVVKVCCRGYRYVTDETNNFSCEPICNEPCSNGSCVSPNTCSCNQGYENRLHMPSKGCVPRCSNKCSNGKCIAPETCSCDAGYELDEPTGRCAPICSTGCPNGFCESPGKCSCRQGYSLASDQTCVPVCTNECAQGRVCVAPNTCSCHERHIDIGLECLPATTESDSSSSTETTHPPVTTMTDCGFADIVQVKCLPEFIKNLKITHLMAIVMLLALIVLSCLMMLRHRRITSKDVERDKEMNVWGSKVHIIN